MSSPAAASSPSPSGAASGCAFRSPPTSRWRCKAPFSTACPTSASITPSASFASGLVAVGYSASPLLSGLGAAALFGVAVGGRFVVGGVLGLAGVALIFWPEIARPSGGERGTLGLVFTVAAVLLSTIGSLAASRNRARGVPLLPAMGFGMLYAAAAAAIVGLVLGRGFAWPTAPSWWLSLAWLALAGSVLAFACFLTLQDRIGPGPAGTVGVMTPLLALLVSLLVEGFRPDLLTLCGLVLAVLGNVLMLQSDAFRRPAAQGWRDGSGMNSVSPGMRAKRCASQSASAARIRSRRLETKFQEMKRCPSGSPPTSATRPPRGAASFGVAPAGTTDHRELVDLLAVDLERVVDRVERALGRERRQLDRRVAGDIEIEHQRQRRRRGLDRRGGAERRADDDMHRRAVDPHCRDVAAGACWNDGADSSSASGSATQSCRPWLR